VKNIKIGTKLVLSFLFIAVLTAVISIHLLYSLDTLDGETDLLYEKGAVPLGMLVKTGEQAQELRIDIRRWQLAKTDESRNALIKSMDETESLMKELISKQKELVFSEAGKNIWTICRLLLTSMLLKCIISQKKRKLTLLLEYA